MSKLESILFALPEDEHIYNMAMESQELHSIIVNMEYYLSLFRQQDYINVGRTRAFLIRLIDDRNLKCLRHKEEPPPDQQ